MEIIFNKITYHLSCILKKFFVHLRVSSINFQLIFDVRGGMKIFAKFSVAFSLEEHLKRL